MNRIICVLLFSLFFSSFNAENKDTVVFKKLINVIDFYIKKENADSVNKYFNIGESYYNSKIPYLGVLYLKHAKYHLLSQNYSTSNEYNFKALDLYEQLGDSLKIAEVYTNIGGTNYEYKHYDEAKRYYNKALSYSSKEFSTLKGIGVLYWKTKKYDSAFFFYRNALLYAKDSVQLSSIYGNISMVYSGQDNKDSTLFYLNKKSNYTSKKDYRGQFFLNFQLGLFYAEALNNNKKGLQYNLKALDYAKKEPVIRIDHVLNNISLNYERLGRYDSANYYLNQYFAVKDSLYNLINEKKIIEQQMNYDFEKKSAIQKQEEIILKESNKRKTITVIFLSIALILAAIIGVLGYYAYTRKKRVSEVLQKQKNVIEQKNNLIIDSISYAQQLQESMLTNDDVLKEYVSNHFLIYKPKDIVSGDFYWFYPIYQLEKGKEEPEQLIIAVADCTGHGVPGAFMSILGIYSIEYVITEMISTLLPNSILDRLNFTFSHKLNKRNRDEVKDSMDLVVANYDKGKKTLNYAGAKGSFILVRDNAVTEYKTDNVSLAKKLDYNYQNFELQLQENDQLYFYSDGLYTQKGGVDNKKMNITIFKQLLLEVSLEPFYTQKRVLEEKIQTWIGKTEQFDDILILGIKV